MRTRPAYYYYDSDGSRVTLDPADAVAVDLATAREAGYSESAVLALGRHSRKLRGNLVLLEKADLPSELEDALDEAGALQPVFRAGDGTLVVVLPEVRIEAADERQATAIRSSLKAATVESEIVRDGGAQLVLRPTSGRGVDALELANRIAETVEPPLAQARFLRVVPRPTVRRPTKR